MPDASQLSGLLRAAFRARLDPLGWEMLEPQDDGHRLAAFLYPLGGEFAATGEVWRASSVPDGPPVLVTEVFAGVSYEPLRRLAPLLDRYDLAVLYEDVWEDEAGLAVETADDAARAAETLVPLLVQRAVPFAERYASVEALTAVAAPMPHAALLAAAGRFDEAREALAQVDAPERSRFERSDRRAVRQLRRWIDSGGDASLIPGSPPPSRLRAPRHRSFAELRSQAAAERAALNEVTAAAQGKSRQEARALLRAALARHGAPERSPLWIETRLDHLWDPPQDRVQQLVRGAARLGLGVAKAIRERELPDLSPPDWLEPPDHALYEVPGSDRWIAAELAPDAVEWLDRVHGATPHPFGFATLTAWLCPAGDALAVHLGERRVGQVPAGDVVAYAGVLADAAARGEHPCLDAHLARRDDGYLLELARP